MVVNGGGFIAAKAARTKDNREQARSYMRMLPAEGIFLSRLKPLA